MILAFANKDGAINNTWLFITDADQLCICYTIKIQIIISKTCHFQKNNFEPFMLLIGCCPYSPLLAADWNFTTRTHQIK